MGGALQKATSQEHSVILSSYDEEQAGSNTHSSQAAAAAEDENVEMFSAVSQERQAGAAPVVAPEAGQAPADPVAGPRQRRLFPMQKKRMFSSLQVC